VRVVRPARDRHAASTLTTKGRAPFDRNEREVRSPPFGGVPEPRLGAAGAAAASLVTAAGGGGGLRRDGSGTAWIVGRRRIDIERLPLSWGERDSCPVKRLAEGKDRAHAELCLHRESEMTGNTAEQWLQWMGCLTALGGSGLLALNCRWSGYCFVLFLASNGFWLALGWIKNTPACS
jgi:hypothetical protein